MKIYRLETFEIFPDKDQTIEDIRASIKKTQDLTVICCINFTDYSSQEKGFKVDVRRKVELFPDTIK